ncbi:uracil-DNA glycosylase family protein [Halogeometricum limi]|uniref:uracil-DNA glycosylase family protein n=1 Tax=Halogeometricum limi TaxID=555875 RepID=UPI0015879F50|nr:uracil-DNA glycosylase family protein [Halogeometricum limi]
MSQESIEETLENIWSNWREEEGRCSHCPARNTQHPPYYGDGVGTADIAFVAEKPGGTQSGRVDGPPPAHVEETHRERNDNRNGMDWIKDGNRLRRFFDSLSSDLWFTKDSEYPAYFTNARKCRKITGENKWGNNHADYWCRQYLEEELTALDPEIVLVFGKPAAESVFAHYEVKDWPSKMSNRVLVEYQSETDDTQIILSYHWSGIGRNVRHVDGVEGTNEYQDKLAKVVDQVLS